MGKMMLRMALISALFVACSMAAPAPAPAPQMDCSSQISVLVSCLDYVKSSGQDAPDPTCCSGLMTVLITAPACICQLLISPAAQSVGVNVTTASALPNKCHVSDANVISQCPGAASSLGLAPEAGGSTPSNGGSSTPNSGSPLNSPFISTPTNMVYLALVATSIVSSLY